MVSKFEFPEPLIVMGMGRSGTRNLADILNISEEVCLHGEIPLPSINHFFKSMREIEKSHSRNETRYANWNYNKLSMIAEYFSSASIGKRENIDHSRLRYFGHKTPKSERHFSLYEEYFSSLEVGCKYIYCMRDPISVYRSFRTVPWSNISNVDTFIENYLRSYDQYEHALKQAGDRVFLFNLNGYLSSDDSKNSVLELFGFLKISPPFEFFDKIGCLENTNSSKKKFGVERAGISHEDRKKIMENEKMRKVISEHFGWVEL